MGKIDNEITISDDSYDSTRSYRYLVLLLLPLNVSSMTVFY